MFMNRIEDKKFEISISEKEALFLADGSNGDFSAHKNLVMRFGNLCLGYIIESCKFPHDKRPTVELDI